MATGSRTRSTISDVFSVSLSQEDLRQVGDFQIVKVHAFSLLIGDEEKRLTVLRALWLPHISLTSGPYSENRRHEREQDDEKKTHDQRTPAIRASVQDSFR